MPFIEEAGKDLWNAGMGIVLGGFQDARQVRQQDRLQRLQIAGQKEMTDYNMMKQLEMWNATNYEAQMEHLKNAGLNPGLIYGMKGGGGVTTGNATGNVQGANAPVGGREIQDIMGMGIQKELLQAQKELLQAQAENVKTDTKFKGGVQTEQTEMQTEVLAQELANKREDNNIKRLEQTMMNIENWEKQATQEDRLNYIQYQTRIALRQAQLLTNDTTISNATVQEQIRIIQKNAIQAGLINELTQAQTDKTRSDIKVNDQQINNFIQQNMREWDKMSQINKEIAIRQMLGEYGTDPVNDAVRNISNLIDNIFFISPKAQQQRTVIEGFNKKY